VRPVAQSLSGAPTTLLPVTLAATARTGVDGSPGRGIESGALARIDKTLDPLLDGPAAARPVIEPRRRSPRPSFSMPLQIFPRKIHTFPSKFQALPRKFQIYSLAISNELKGLPAARGDFLGVEDSRS
jgi:hypothetical protein